MLLCIEFHFKPHFCGAAAARDCVPVCRPWRSACNDFGIFIHLNQSPCTIAPLDTCMHRCSGIHRHRTHHVRLGYMRPERQLHTRAARPRVSRLFSVRCARAAASMCRLLCDNVCRRSCAGQRRHDFCFDSLFAGTTHTHRASQ